MPAIAITGGVATGKSTFCHYLRELLRQARFFDADQAARQIVDLAHIKNAVRKEFGAEMFSGSGELNRAAVRAIILRDAAKRRALEQILHPPIRAQWSALAETHRNSPDFFFADIPLLYETGGEILCDRVVVVACSRSVQVERLRARGSGNVAQLFKLRSGERQVENLFDQPEAEAMINSQMPLEEKIKRADHVVWNNNGPDVLRVQTKLLVDLWRTEKWTKP
ncbi:MAG TPA: dephospho-CoA kinase [Chthoniobacterales bacterium]|nr:dephospho-CoA kinase [Chthoniobacterales bacterium]